MILKREIPYLLSLHCVAYKLELAFQDAAKDVVLFREAKELRPSRTMEILPLFAKSSTGAEGLGSDNG